MGRLKKNSINGNVRTGLRVRHEIIGYLYRNPLVPVKIPTSVDLARHFGVARCTITDEIRKLIEEGLLIGKRGIGTFTNPEAISFTSKVPGKKVVGILVGDGQYLCHDYTSWVLLSAAGKALLPDIGHPVNIELGERIPELMCKEISLRNMDGVIWILPPERMASSLKKLHEKVMPVVTLFSVFPGVPGVEMDFLKYGKDIGEIFKREGKTKIGWCAFDKWSRTSCSEAKKAYANSGTPAQGWIEWDNPLVFEQNFEKVFCSHQGLDAIYVHGELPFMVMDIIKKNGSDPYKDCLLCVDYGVVRKIKDFKGLVRNFPLEEMGCMAAEMLRYRFKNKSTVDNIHRKLEITMEYCQ